MRGEKWQGVEADGMVVEAKGIGVGAEGIVVGAKKNTGVGTGGMGVRIEGTEVAIP